MGKGLEELHLNRYNDVIRVPAKLHRNLVKREKVASFSTPSVKRFWRLDLVSWETLPTHTHTYI